MPGSSLAEAMVDSSSATDRAPTERRPSWMSAAAVSSARLCAQRSLTCVVASATVSLVRSAASTAVSWAMVFSASSTEPAASLAVPARSAAYEVTAPAREAASSLAVSVAPPP